MHTEYPASTKGFYKSNVECLAVNVKSMFCASDIRYMFLYSSCQTCDQTSSQKGGHAIGQIISYQCLHVDSWVQSQASVCGKFGGQSGTKVSHWVLW